MQFDVLKVDGEARHGLIKFRRGNIETPVFMPVGTLGTVKTLSPAELLQSGSQIILGNTFHLNLRPGLEVINKHGTLHDFMNWRKPILTDSGGFQVWSLAKKKDISEDGVLFKSPIDGSKIFLTPEESIRIQRYLGSDIVMCFDECTGYPSSHSEARYALDRSLRWAKRCSKIELDDNQVLFGISQGGMHIDLRLESLSALAEIKFSGYALGGLSVGEPKEEMLEVLDKVAKHLPHNKPRYLMGVGKPEDLLAGVASGIDMFDCVLPTRNARNGWLYTKTGVIKLKHSAYKYDTKPVEEGCKCLGCTQFSRSYLRHLYMNSELLGSRICTLHNLYFFHNLMSDIRDSINRGQFSQFRKGFLDNYNAISHDMA